MTKTHPIFRILAIVLILASLGMVFVNWMSTDYSYYERADMIFGEAELIGFGNAMEREDNLIFFIATLLLLLTAILGIVLIALGLRFGGIPCFVGSLFSFFVVLYALQWKLEYMGLGAWLCVGFALLAMILAFLPDTRAKAAVPGAAPPRPSTWTCPKCGTILADRERFCPNCGNSRAVNPASAAPVTPVLRCAACGATLGKSSAFCPNCGASVRAAAPAAPVAPARPAAPAAPVAPTRSAPPAAPAYAPPRAPGYSPPSAPAAPAYRPATPPAYTPPVDPDYTTSAFPRYAPPSAPARHAAPAAPKAEPGVSAGFHAAGDDDL